MDNQGTRRPFHASFAGRIGVARADITPPVGIYARNWGAAAHDTAQSIHRPLTLTAMVLSSSCEDDPLVLLDADLGWWRSPTLFEHFQTAILEKFQLPSSSLIFAVTHTHSAAAMAGTETSLPGCELLGPYRQKILDAAIEAITRALESATQAVLDWNIGRCMLAHVRDLPDPNNDRMLCGYNPDIEPDDTLVVGRVSDGEGKITATIVNYACHPTTLAWENTAVSPDYIGAMRETIEAATDGAPALFLQGASGELAPRYQYVGDPAVADRHGRQLAYSVLATLEDMEPAGLGFEFDRAVESGAPLGVWRHHPATASAYLDTSQATVEIPLKPWPTAEELEQQRLECQDRALEERLRRKRDIRRELGDGTTFRLPIWTWKLGDAILVGSMAEAYSKLQMEIRRRFPDHVVLCVNLVNGSIGYLPCAELYDTDIYQVWQTPFDRGSLEIMLEAMCRSIEQITGQTQ